jgi:glycosyltransferase involved in cell wall biosynthesis
MPAWLFIGPSLLSGIGQVTNRYAQLVKGEYVQIGQVPSANEYDIGFAFVLPIEHCMNNVDALMSRCKKKIYMTICETETVHPLYGQLVERYKTLYVASEFCRNIFARQFPQGDWRILHLWQTAYDGPVKSIVPKSDAYTFYTIGNVIDQRKNIRMLLESFVRLNMPNTRLIIKATCHTEVTWKFPRVEVINGLLDDASLEDIHRSGHCYINCSHSEGVGMGAVEAALRNKPVIITSYGGLKEYVRTPFIVNADELVAVGNDAFLFTKEMLWGNPKLEDLMKHMRTCAEGFITTWDHAFSKALIGEIGPSMEALASPERSSQY